MSNIDWGSHIVLTTVTGSVSVALINLYGNVGMPVDVALPRERTLPLTSPGWRPDHHFPTLPTRTRSWCELGAAGLGDGEGSGQ